MIPKQARPTLMEHGSIIRLLPQGGGALKLKATPKSTTSVKLSWTKIKGAKGYEIYRCEGSSIGDTVAAGMTNNFAKYKLIKIYKCKGFPVIQIRSFRAVWIITIL